MVLNDIGSSNNDNQVMINQDWMAKCLSLRSHLVNHRQHRGKDALAQFPGRASKPPTQAKKIDKAAVCGKWGLGM